MATPEGIDLEWVDNDGGFGGAFALGTVDPVTVALVDRAEGAVVLHASVDLREGRLSVVAVVEALRAAGGLAVRVEQSGLGWDVRRWLEVFGSDDPWAWHHHAVVYVGDDDAVQSCGMHAFALPDVRLPRDGSDPAEVQRFGEVLSCYQLSEDPVIRSGETFQPDHDTPRRRVERWPDLEHDADHAFHNPYGVWRVGPPGSTARGLGELEMVFVPPLRLVLAAAEQQAGGPLDEAGVLGVRDAAACIAMEPRHAQAMERSRGYADLDPELAWEQWRALRPR